MGTTLQDRLVAFLENDLSISRDAISIVLRRKESDASLIPVILWQYGLINITQLSQILDWLETA